MSLYDPMSYCLLYKFRKQLYFLVLLHSLFYALMSCLIQNTKDDTAAVLQQLRAADSEVKALRSMTQRMILTQKEMVCTQLQYLVCGYLNQIFTISFYFQEEVVLKRCWLARYWGLAAKYGIYWKHHISNSSQKMIFFQLQMLVGLTYYS